MKLRWLQIISALLVLPFIASVAFAQSSNTEIKELGVLCWQHEKTRFSQSRW